MPMKTLEAPPKYESIRKILIAKRKGVVMLSQDDLKTCISSQDKSHVSDEMDLATAMSDEHLQATITNTHRKAIVDIDNALARIKEGTYGICIECEDEISPKRLEAFPVVKRCIDCQEQYERDVKQASAAGLHICND